MKNSGFRQKTLAEVKDVEKEKQIIRELRRKFQEKELAKRKKDRDKLKAFNAKEREKLKKENSLPLLCKKLWDECKRIIRKRYQTKTGIAYCYTCGKIMTEGREMHTAHMIPKSVCPPHMKYNLDNLRICCYHCNINLGGNGFMFNENMRRIEGDEYVNNIKDHCFKSEYYQKVNAEWYKDKIEEYKNL